MSEAQVRTELIAIDAGDGIVLNGAAWLPDAGAGDVGIALFPGTGAEFYQSWIGYAGPRLAAAGYPTIALNRRDHGAMFGFHTMRPSAMDHRHAVDFLAQRGARRVVLAGHSYGTLTVPLYVRISDDARVAGLILYAPLGDMRTASARILGGQEAYDRLVAEAEARLAEGQGDAAFLFAPMVPGQNPICHTYEVFLDKRGPASEAVGHELIRHVGDRPLLGVRDPADPYPATQPPAQEQLQAANANLTYVLLDSIPRDRIDDTIHLFSGREPEVLDITLGWLAANGFAP